MSAHFIDDTIAAIGTPAGIGGISIIRISGGKAIDILSKLFISHSGIKKFKSHRVYYGRIYMLDDVLVTVMLAPNSYTRQDVVEINCHGGQKSRQLILEAVLENGARLAEPGEFTKRAFLNGRIDLSQAESVADIIGAKTELSHKYAFKQLKGGLSEKINGYRNEILSMLANIEASIDYPEHDMDRMNLCEIKQKSLKLAADIERLYKTADMGVIIRNGIEAVITGRPNVGKSSLMNAVLDEDRAIVTNIPGTTRDILAEYVNILGMPVKLSDTAGVRKTEDEIEKIGVGKTIKQIENADLILFVVDMSEMLRTDDFDILEIIKDKRVITVLNKCDLPQKADIEYIKKLFSEEHIVKVSCMAEQGFDELYKKIKQMFLSDEILDGGEALITGVRQKNALYNAMNSLKNAVITIEDGFTEDMAAIDLTESYNFLGEITGDTTDEDIIDRIFSEFCLGK